MDAVFIKAGHLAEGLQREIGLLLGVGMIDQAHIICASGLFERPADAQVTDQSPGPLRDRAQCCDDGQVHVKHLGEKKE